MSVFLTEELERFTSTRENTESVFCFCSHQDENCNTASTVLRNLIHQITIKRPKLLKHAIPFFNTPEKGKQALTSVDTLWLIFRNLVRDVDLGAMFCVLDGLDEGDDSSVAFLVPKLVKLFTGRDPLESTTGFHLAIISRDVHGLQQITRIKLDPDNNEEVSSDIQNFITTRIQELSNVEGFNDDVRETIHKRLSEGAAGTFLWVGFTMHELLQKRTCTELLETLTDLPRGLPAMYERMLHRIPAAKRGQVSLALQWVTLAFRPLGLEELAVAINLNTSNPLISLEQAARDTIALCGPLLVIENGQVSLVHQSARDYLLRVQEDSDPALETFRTKLDTTHLELAKTCLTKIAQSYLQYHPYEWRHDSDQEPLLRYAVHYWPQHALSCSNLATKLLKSHRSFFGKHSLLRDRWWDGYKLKKYLSTVDLPKPCLLSVACYLGIMPIIEKVLAKQKWHLTFSEHIGRSVETRNKAIKFAVSGGHEMVVRMLIERGWQLDTKYKYWSTPLLQACNLNYTALAKLLIQKGSNLSAKDSRGYTPLHYCALNGNEEISQVLISKGVDIWARTAYGETVLHAAATGGNANIFLMILDQGIDIHAKSKLGESALFIAVISKHWEIIESALEKGADVHEQDDHGRTLLHIAVLRGPRALVQFLLEKGIDVNIKDSYGSTALQMAVDKERKDIVLLLFVHRANMSKNPLFLAVARGDLVTAHLLLEKGAVPKSPLLHLAISKESVALAQLLLHWGADLNESDNDITPLHIAIISNSTAMVQFLLEHGADIEKKSLGVAPLCAAIRITHVALVKLLLDGGADVVMAIDSNYDSTLHTAISNGWDLSIIQLLVERGADVQAKNKFRGTARDLALRCGKYDIVDYFDSLEKSARR